MKRLSDLSEIPIHFDPHLPPDTIFLVDSDKVKLMGAPDGTAYFVASDPGALRFFDLSPANPWPRFLEELKETDGEKKDLSP